MIDIQQGDCLELMWRIPDASIDMILCDLPYGITHNSFDVRIPFEPLWAQYTRVIKDSGAIVLFGNEPFASELRMSNLKMYRYDWIWYKHYRRNFLNAKKMPLRATEQLCVFGKKCPEYYPIMRKGKMRQKGAVAVLPQIWGGNYGSVCKLDVRNDTYYPIEILDFPGVATSKQNHPTEKPVALLEYLIRTYTREGETVLDNCMGSGSTGVACVNTGRSFIGYEKEERFFQIAERRIREAEEQKEGCAHDGRD